jgi:hypothetical protein
LTWNRENIMSEWYGDMKLLDEEITTEECAAGLWESDVCELMPEHWEQMMSGPDDREFEAMEGMIEEALDRQIEKEALEIAASIEWDGEDGDVSGDMDESTEGKTARFTPACGLSGPDDDIPF